MNRIKVKVEWCDTNFGAVTESEALNGMVIVTHKTYDGLLAELSDAVHKHIQEMIENGDPLPAWIENGDYEFDIEYSSAALPRRQ